MHDGRTHEVRCGNPECKCIDCDCDPCSCSEDKPCGCDARHLEKARGGQSIPFS